MLPICGTVSSQTIHCISESIAVVMIAVKQLFPYTIDVAPTDEFHEERRAMLACAIRRARLCLSTLS